MNELEKKIEKEKKRYQDFIKKNNEKKIMIYGAGKQAKMLTEFLNTIGLTIDGYCVTEKAKNKEYENNIKIYQVDDSKLKKEDIAFLVGVRSQLNSEIEQKLKENGFDNYLLASDYIRYLGKYGYDFYMNPMLEITTKVGCSVNCKYCPQSTFINKYFESGECERYLSLDNYKKCIDKLPSNVLIEFAGFTESLLNDNCIEMVEYAIEKKHNVNMFTTLVGADINVINKFLKIDFKEFVLHLPDKENLSNIELSSEYINMVKILTDAKKTNGTDFVDYACSQGQIPDSLYEIIKNKIRIYIVLNDRAGNLQCAELYHKNNITGKIRCELAHDINHNVLLPDGRIVICSNDWGMKHVLGNLLEQTYEEIINGKEAQNIRADMKNINGSYSLCRNCFQAIQY